MRDADYARLADFRQALRAFLRVSEAAVAGVGLSGQQYQALPVERAAPAPKDMPASELARQLLIKQHRDVGLVDRLVAQQLLLRKPSRKGKRKVELMLTASSRRVLARLADGHRHARDDAGPALSTLLAQVTRSTAPGSSP